MNERDKTAQMMQDSAGNSWGTEAHFQAFADLIRADEREAFVAFIQSYPHWFWLGNNAKEEIVQAVLVLDFSKFARHPI